METELKKDSMEHVLIYASSSKEIEDAIVEKWKTYPNLELVRLDGKVITDFFKMKAEQQEVTSQEEKIKQFLQNQDNRRFAEQQAVKLYKILTNGDPLENAEQHIFTEYEVCKYTNLSHNKARQLFDLLKAFGILEFTPHGDKRHPNKMPFVMHFTEERCRETIFTEFQSVALMLKDDVLRMRSRLKADANVTPEQIAEMEQRIKQVLDDVIK